ncbi:WD repeat-containing protein on Y chromosome-like [Styela clava]
MSDERKLSVQQRVSKEGNFNMPRSGNKKSDAVTQELGDKSASGDSLISEKSNSRSSSIMMDGRRNSDEKSKTVAKPNGKKNKANGSSSEKVDDQMNYEHLKELEKIFEDAKSEGAEGLSMDQFRIAMKKTMGEHIDDRQLDLMFMKVDNNCDGTVDWDEYLSYMLLEYQEKENMSTMDQDKPFPNPLVEKSSNHIESICRITMLQASSSRQSPDNSDADDAASRYLTLSKEGILNVWNLDWQLQKTMNLRGNSKSIWFTDMTCMANCNSFVVSSSEYEISFYTITSNLIQKKFQIKRLRCCALTLDYSFDRKDPQKSVLLWGDTGGNIFIVRFYENPNVALFSNSKLFGGRTILDKMMKMESTNFTVMKISEVHGDWVQQVRYFSNNKGQECLLSCCVQQESALFFADITDSGKSNKISVNRKSYFTIRKGVLCLTYDPDWNLIITGSRDCDVRVWNPFIVARSLAVLKGHHAAVLHVVLRKADHQAVSISKDSNIRVWDLRYYTCKQNINGRNVCLGRLDITSAYFHEGHKELAIGTNKIGIFSPKNSIRSSTNRKQATSHQKAVTCVLYNKLFHQIVTGGEDSMVCMWDMNNGKKTMQFCAERGVEITSMTFDPTWRRLVTGLRNGATMLWNFNNGACLRRLTRSDGLEISDIIFSKQRIVTAGWGKQPVVYMDSYSDDECFTLNRKHGDDIMSLDYHRHEAILASSAYDGDIYLWSLETKDVHVAFNMHKSLLPMHIGGSRKRNGEDEMNITDHKTGSFPGLHKQQNSSCTSVNTSDENIGVANECSRKQRKKRKESNRSIKEKTQIKEMNAKFTASGTEINSADIWLPNSMPWIRKQNQKHTSKRVHFDDSDEDDIQIEDESSFEITDKAVYKLLFLQTRNNSDTSAILIASNDNGWITAWSLNTRGGLLAYFRATKQETGMVISMATDSEDRILITGDSKGYIRVWHIENYCNGGDVILHRKIQDQKRMHRNERERNSMYFQPYMPITEPPQLQMSVMGHTKAVTSVAFIERHGLIASGSVDCSVRLWTITGRYIGTFGQKNLWSLEFPIVPQNLPTGIPEDIRRCASTTTLKTMKGGYHAQWKQVKNAVNFFVKAGRTLQFFKPAGEQDEKKRKLSVRNRFDEVDKEILEESTKKTGTRRKSVTVWLSDVPHAISVVKKPDDKVENSFLRLQNEGIRSSILGKINYKPKKRHRENGISKPITWFNQHASVYNTLPYSHLSATLEPTLPDYIKRATSASNPKPNDPANALHCAMLSKKAGSNWQRRSNKSTKDTDSKVKVGNGSNTTDQGGSSISTEIKNLLQSSKLPPIGSEILLKSAKSRRKTKHAPFALPSIAT